MNIELGLDRMGHGGHGGAVQCADAERQALRAGLRWRHVPHSGGSLSVGSRPGGQGGLGRTHVAAGLSGAGGDLLAAADDAGAGQVERDYAAGEH